MSDNIVIYAKERSELGKGASRRLRRIAGLVPAVLYGADEPAQSISIPHKDLMKSAENEVFFSSVLDIDLNGKVVPAILKDMQRHPAKPTILHADFLRVDMKKAIHMNVPLHFINEESCHGVKMEGGRIQHNLVEVEVSCLPSALPEFIEVDMTAVNLGQIVHISDLNLPEGVESLALSHGEDHDLPVASVVAIKGSAEDDEVSEGDEPSEDEPQAE